MKILRFGLLTLLTCLLGVTSASAQFNNVGTSAANFLKIPVGARGTAVGGAYTALVDDASSLYWNAAGMTGVTGNEVSISTNLWLLDLRHDFIAGVFSLDNFSRLGVSISYMSMGSMEETTPEQPTGTGLEFNAYDVAFGLAYARRLTDRFSVGGQAKYIIETIAKSKASGVAFDLGLLYHSDWNDLRIGGSITNFGPDLQMTGNELRQKLDPYPNTGSNPDDVPHFMETEHFSLPMQFQVGASIIPYRNESMSLTTMLEVRDARDFNQEVRVGGEILIMNTLYLRGGANLFLVEGSIFGGGDDVVVEGGDSEGNTDIGTKYTNPTTITRSDLRDGQALFNVGAGVKYYLPNSRTGFRFDYAFSRIQTLDDAHRISVSFDF